MSDQCQYAFCETDPDGALEFFFGERWFCDVHYTDVLMAWNGETPEIIEEPFSDTDD